MVNGSDAAMRLVVFGGEVMPECCSNSFDNDTWVLDVSTGQWELMETFGGANAPSKRTTHFTSL